MDISTELRFYSLRKRNLRKTFDDIESQFDFFDKSISKRQNQLLALEGSLRSQIEQVKLREKHVESFEESVNLRFKEVETREVNEKRVFEERAMELELMRVSVEERSRDVDLLRAELDEGLCALESQDKQFRLFENSVNDKSKELEIVRDSINESLTELDLKEKAFDAKSKELEMVQNTIQESSRELDRKEEQIKLLEESADAKSKELETVQNSIDERFKELNLKEEQLKLLEESVDAKTKELDYVRNSVAESSRELAWKEEQLKLFEKSVDAKSKELFIIRTSIRKKLKELELKEKQLDLKLRSVRAKSKELKTVQNSIKERFKEVNSKEEHLKLLDKSVDVKSRKLELKEKQLGFEESFVEKSKMELEFREKLFDVNINGKRPPLTGFMPWASHQQGPNVTNSNLHAPPAQFKKITKAPPEKHVWSNGVSGVDSSTANFQRGVVPKTAGSRGSQGTQALSVPSTQAAPQFQHPNELNKIHEEAHAAYLKEEAFQQKLRALQIRDATKAGNGLASQATTLVSSSAKKRKIDERDMPNQKVSGFSTTIKSDSSRDFSPEEKRIMLMKKARMDVSKAVNEWKLAESVRTSKKMDALAREKAEKKKEIGKGATDGVNCCVNKPTIIKHFPATLDDTENVKLVTMSVPDSDFYDFDKDCLEKSFGAGQVWAVYDNDDGMPRFYAMIQDVVSLKPFKMKISWLNSKSNTELAPIDWITSGFVKSCGHFLIGMHKIYTSLNAFSHKVSWKKGSRGVICIYPTKGDVWALYKNWSPKWDVHTPDETVHKYEMVKVLEDYNEEEGVTVAQLVKVAGFKTVFHQHLNPEKFRTFKKEELFRFSHQIPSYVLTGQECPNDLKGCLELDPASTPMELQNVITEVKEE